MANPVKCVAVFVLLQHINIKHPRLNLEKIQVYTPANVFTKDSDLEKLSADSVSKKFHASKRLRVENSTKDHENVSGSELVQL
jgi:hypothetical protein